MHRMPRWPMAGVLGLIFIAPSALPQDQGAMSDSQQQVVLRIAKQVRKEILSLPQYGVFDDIRYGIRGGDTVVLQGEASRPMLKSSIEKVVKKIEGVKDVKNEIEVLPVSSTDDRIRAAVYASIYRYAPLQKYTSNRGMPQGPSVARRAGGITNDPPIGWHSIHIIVKGGNVTLTGAVDSDADSALAEMRANSVPGIFSVVNNLEVPKSGE